MQGQVSIKKGGRVSYYVQGVVAADESEKNSARTTAGLASAAIAGKPHGRPSYGWTREYTYVPGVPKPIGKEVINEAERDVVVEMARRVLAGQSLRGIVDDLNGRGVPAPGAGRVLRRDSVTRDAVAWADALWSPAKVRAILLRRSNVGLRSYTTGGEGVDAVSAEYDATWPPLLDPTTYAQVCAVLEAPERRTSLSNRPLHLLSGIATCGVCGRTLVGQKVKDPKHPGVIRCTYRCPDSHVFKSEPRTDLVVVTALMEYLVSPELREAVARGSSDERLQAEEQRAVQRAKLAELEAAYDGDKMPLETFLRLSTRARTKLVEAEGELARRRDGAVFADLVAAEDVGQAWDDTPLDRQRAVVASLLTVTLLKSTQRGRAAFDPTSIVLGRRSLEG
jgi:hypothetical protein